MWRLDLVQAEAPFSPPPERAQYQIEGYIPPSSVALDTNHCHVANVLIVMCVLFGLVC